MRTTSPLTKVTSAREKNDPIQLMRKAVRSGTNDAIIPAIAANRMPETTIWQISNAAVKTSGKIGRRLM